MVSELSDEPVQGIQQVRLEEMPEPVLSSLPEESVVVTVSHCAVHWVDCLMVAGQYQQAPPLPYTPGMEYTGTVLHPGTSHLSPGDLVAWFCPAPEVTGHFRPTEALPLTPWLQVLP